MITLEYVKENKKEPKLNKMFFVKSSDGATLKKKSRRRFCDLFYQSEKRGLSESVFEFLFTGFKKILKMVNRGDGLTFEYDFRL